MDPGTKSSARSRSAAKEVPQDLSSARSVGQRAPALTPGVGAPYLERRCQQAIAAIALAPGTTRYPCDRRSFQGDQRNFLLLLDRHLDDLAGEGVVALLVVGGDVGLAVEADVRAFIGREHEGLGLRDLAFGDLLAVDAEDRLAAGAGLGRVGDELVADRVLAGRERRCRRRCWCARGRRSCTRGAACRPSCRATQPPK